MNLVYWEREKFDAWTWIKSIAMDGARAGAIAILSSNSTRRDPMPVKLPAIAANAQVFEHRLAFELDLPFVARLGVDEDLRPPLEIHAVHVLRLSFGFAR
jgi:hypothetical protein